MEGKEGGRQGQKYELLCVFVYARACVRGMKVRALHLDGLLELLHIKPAVGIMVQGVEYACYVLRSQVQVQLLQRRPQVFGQQKPAARAARPHGCTAAKSVLLRRRPEGRVAVEDSFELAGAAPLEAMLDLRLNAN
jgi:hypothetical protein